MLRYLAPAAVLVAAGLIALRWPRAAAALLVTIGVGAGGWWLSVQTRRSMAAPHELLLTALLMTQPVILAGLLYLFEARHRRLLREECLASSRRWLVRNWRPLVVVGLPIAATVTLAVQQLPVLAARHDDHLRGTRTIRSGTATLVWAPHGPGWNQVQPDGQYPAWKALLRHGPLAMDRCAYLSEAGTVLLDEPIREWRMPAVREIVGALSRHGANAGCTWDGQSPLATCRIEPDKETPLWAPDEAPIYYWSGQEASAGTAFAVNYTGGISVLPKSVNDLGIGYRCVKTLVSAR
jgi:hypothetical protein